MAVFLVDLKRPTAPAGAYPQRHLGQRMWPMFCDSVLRQYPEARFSILTTPESTLPNQLFAAHIFAHPIGERPLPYERLRHYIRFLEEGEDDCSYLFLESDMLMLGRFRLDVREEWDLAIAYKNKGMWINAGMLLVRAGRRDAALGFLRKALQIYEDRYLDHPKWGADQAAFRDAAEMVQPPNCPTVQSTPEARVLLVPREDYTRYPTRFAALKPPRTWILHFAGPRKKWMSGYYWLQFGKGAWLGRLLSRITGARNAAGRSPSRSLSETSPS
ncbi:MAG: hypothetical protein HOP28_16040 [Gemmatimonadales bacterium]|nr:hypothetical protein [Gemmatimonadales bacterium]